MRKGAFDIRIKHEHVAIIDTNIKDLDQLDDVLKEVKRKFK